MVGLLPVTAEMTPRLTLGYRRAVTRSVSPLGCAGSELRGHEFHYSTTTPQGDALDIVGAAGTERSGFATPQIFASYLHTHLGASPELAEQFVLSASRSR
jgi:cobyrinic acid a,c-diamide synthase